MVLGQDPEGRPSISLTRLDNSNFFSDFESVTEEKILRDDKKKENYTIMNMTLNQIVENTVNLAASFSSEYKKHYYNVSSNYKLYNQKGTFITTIMHYLLAFINYLGDKDNILYVGIILCFISIIIYFFNISTSQ